MDSKLLTENSWKTVAQKNKIKDNGLMRALAVYEALDEDEHDDRLAKLALVSQFAAALKRTKEVASAASVAKYLTDLSAAAESEQRDITKAKAQAEKAGAKARKEAAAQSDQSGDDSKEDEEADDEGGDAGAKLLAAVQKLRSSPDLSYQFIVCDAKPVCGLMIAKRITAQHKAQLTQLTGGKRFLPLGACRFEAGKLNFSMDQPVSGLARKLQQAIKEATGKQIPIVVGIESEEGDDQQPSSPQPGGEPAGASETAEAPPRPVPPPTLPRATLAGAPRVWHGTRDIVDQNIQALKHAVRGEYANEDPNLLKEIDQNMAKLDGILDKLDHRLADSLTKANEAANPTAKAAELRNAKAILADYIKYVKSETLIAHIDANPFGVKTDLKKTLTDSLTHMAQAIG